VVTKKCCCMVRARRESKYYYNENAIVEFEGEIAKVI
jgi:hypothetical protein